MTERSIILPGSDVRANVLPIMRPWYETNVAPAERQVSEYLASRRFKCIECEGTGEDEPGSGDGVKCHVCNGSGWLLWGEYQTEYPDDAAKVLARVRTKFGLTPA